MQVFRLLALTLATIFTGGFCILHAGDRQEASVPGSAAVLRQLIDLAVAHNRDLEAARLAVDSANYDLETTRATYWFAGIQAGNLLDRDQNFFSGQRLSGTTLGTTLDRRLFTGATVGARHVVDLRSGSDISSAGVQRLDVSFRQPLLRGAGRTVTEAAIVTSRNNLETSRAALSQATINLVGAVQVTYLNLVLQNEALKIQMSAFERSQRLKATTEALIAAGRLAKSEIAQSEADVAAQEVALIGAEEAVKVAENDLRDVLDTEIPPSLPIAMLTEIVPDAAEKATALQLALMNRPDWRAAQLALETSDLAVKVARSNQLYALDFTTTVRAGASATGLASSFSGLTGQGSVVGVQLDVPINNTSNSNAHRGALIARRQQQLGNDELRQQIELGVDDAVRSVNLQIRQLELTRRARELAEQALRVETEKLRVGRSTGLNVVQLQNAVKVALLGELQAKVAYLLARADLDRESGTTLVRWNLARP